MFALQLSRQVHIITVVFTDLMWSWFFDNVQVFSNIVFSLELALAVPNFVLNIYFAIRLYRLATINANLKIILVSESIFFAYSTTAHAIANFIPKESVRYVEGNYNIATTFHVSMWITAVSHFYFDMKFMLVAIERMVAFKRKSTYEMEGASVGNKIFWTALFISIILALIKSICIWRLNPHLEFDERLRKVTVIDKYMPGLLLSYNIASVGMFYAIYVFYSLSKKVKNLQSLSLSESYEIRQIVAALAWLKRLIKAFFIGVLANLPFINLTSYLYFNHGYDEDDPLMVLILTIVFTIANVYCLITTFYMFQEFPQLRKAVYKDFPCLNMSKPSKILTTTERNTMYFDSLKTSWRHPNEKPS